MNPVKIHPPEDARYRLIFDGHQEIIVDSKENRNLFFLAQGGHGVRSDIMDAAKRVVDFLNREPQ